MQNLHSVLFRADITQWTKRYVRFDIDQPDLKAFLASYSDGRWALVFKDDISRDEPALRAAIYQAVGQRDFPVEIITTGHWELTALVADTFRSGRVFLAGDAAHTLPPNRGGYGANTGYRRDLPSLQSSQGCCSRHSLKLALELHHCSDHSLHGGSGVRQS